MKKYLFFLIGFIIAGAVVGGMNLVYQADANRPYGPARSQCSDHPSTTSPDFLYPSSSNEAASSTCIFDIATADSADLNIALTASTSPTELYYTYDRDSATRNWFAEKAYTATSNNLRTYGSGALISSITPNDTVASTTYHSISLENLVANYMKVEYSLAGNTASGSVYFELVK